MRQLAPRTDGTAQLLAAALNESMRLHLIDSFTERSTPSVRSDRLLGEDEQARLVDYIDGGSVELGSTVAALADQVDMTVDTFKKAFAATFHTTPRQFVLDRRIAMARALLADPTYSIADISARLGFSSTSHFTTVFKKRVGVTPPSTGHAGRSSTRVDEVVVDTGVAAVGAGTTRTRIVRIRTSRSPMTEVTGVTGGRESARRIRGSAT